MTNHATAKLVLALGLMLVCAQAASQFEILERYGKAGYTGFHPDKFPNSHKRQLEGSDLCTPYSPKAGLTYDVSALKLSTDVTAYEVTDQHSMDDKNYTFSFNVCNNAKKPPKCTATGAAPAWQWKNDGTECFKCANDITVNAPWFFLHDYRKPSDGFSIWYTHGDDLYCEAGHKRTFTLTFFCFDAPFDLTPGVDQPTLVLEDNPCSYEAVIFSRYGCPTQCPGSGDKYGMDKVLCSNQGVCGYDPNMASARCFCDDGYYESNCLPPPDSMPKGAIAGAYFAGLLGAGLVVVGFLYFKRKQSVAETESVDGFYE